MKGISIYDNIHVAMVGIDYVKISGQKCILLHLGLRQNSMVFCCLYHVEAWIWEGFGKRMAEVVFNLTMNSSSKFLVNQRVMGRFSLAKLARQGCPMAPLLFATATHPFIVAMHHVAQTGWIEGLALTDGDQLLTTLFVDDSFLFLQVDSTNLRRALQVV